MGAAQAFQWAVQYPDFVDAIIPYAGAARTSIHNNVFLEGVKCALIAVRRGESRGIGKGQSFPSPGPWSAEETRIGLKAFGNVYAGWGFSQTFYREKTYKGLGFRDTEDFLTNFWEAWALSKGEYSYTHHLIHVYSSLRVSADLHSDPDNLLVMLQTWQLGDVSAGPKFQGDFGAAMRSIKAKTLIMPSSTDLYFPVEDSKIEVESMTPGIGKLLPIPSTSGHFAAAPALKQNDWAFLHGAIVDFLGEVEAAL